MRSKASSSASTFLYTDQSNSMNNSDNKTLQTSHCSMHVHERERQSDRRREGSDLKKETKARHIISSMKIKFSICFQIQNLLSLNIRWTKLCSVIICNNNKNICFWHTEHTKRRNKQIHVLNRMLFKATLLKTLVGSQFAVLWISWLI